MPLMALLLVLSDAGPPQITDFPTLGRALVRCIRTPERSAGSRLTIRLSLRRDGSVFGAPMVTFSRLVGRPEDRQALITATLQGIKACDPFPLDPSFGQSIAGRPFSLSIVATHKAIRT